MRSYGGSCVAEIVIRFWRWRNGTPVIFGQPSGVWVVLKADADLAVSSDKKPTLAGVNPELGEVVDFDFLNPL